MDKEELYQLWRNTIVQESLENYEKIEILIEKMDSFISIIKKEAYD